MKLGPIKKKNLSKQGNLKKLLTRRIADMVSCVVSITRVIVNESSNLLHYFKAIEEFTFRIYLFVPIENVT